MPDLFDIGISDRESGFDWAGGVDVGLNYQPSPNLVLMLVAAADIGGRDTIRVRANPSEPATGIRREMAVDWSLSLGGDAAILTYRPSEARQGAPLVKTGFGGNPIATQVGALSKL